MNKITEISCYYNSGDSISSLEICDSGSNYYGEMYFMCENKHVLKFYRNIDGTISKDSLSDYFDTFYEKYKLFFQSTPPKVSIHYEYVTNFMTTEYYYGAAYGIRTLTERIIYENYGVYFFSNSEQLYDPSNKDKIIEISKTINSIGFNKMIILLMSEKERKNVLKSVDFYADLDLKGKSLEYAKNVSKEVEDNLNNNIFLNKEEFKTLQDVYNKASIALHGREPWDSAITSENLEKILGFYQVYFARGNEWRTIYVG